MYQRKIEWKRCVYHRGILAFLRFCFFVKCLFIQVRICTSYTFIEYEYATPRLLVFQKDKRNILSESRHLTMLDWTHEYNFHHNVIFAFLFQMCQNTTIDTLYLFLNILRFMQHLKDDQISFPMRPTFLKIELRLMLR